MSTEDKSDGSVTQEESEIYNDLENDVQEITLEYIRNFLDIDVKKDKADIEKNLISMEAFTSYFDTGILRYPEQTIDQIRILYSRFDSELTELTGLSIDDYISFYQLVCDTFETAMGVSKTAIDNIKNFLSSLNPYAVDVEKEYERLLNFAQGSSGMELQSSMDGLNTIRRH